jgi:hypothetical protein
MSLPEPLTPADCDLRNFPTVPIDGARLFGSEFHARSSDAGWRAGMSLWLKSWHQVPAASIPDDDTALARLAEFGRDIRGWKKVREEALHGWVKCADGRLYHPVMAEKANHAWKKKQSFKARSEKGNEARWGSQKEHSGVSKSDPSRMQKASLNDPKERVRERDSTLGSKEPNDAASASQAVADPEKVMFDAGVKLLSDAGMSPAKARPLIGKWKRDHGSANVIEALGRAKREGAIDPVGFIEGCFRAHRRSNTIGTGSWQDDFAGPC